MGIFFMTLGISAIVSAGEVVAILLIDPAGLTQSDWTVAVLVGAFVGGLGGLWPAFRCSRRTGWSNDTGPLQAAIIALVVGLGCGLAAFIPALFAMMFVAMS